MESSHSVHLYIHEYTLAWYKNKSYFYFSSLVSNFVTHSIKKMYAKETAKNVFFLHPAITAIIAFCTLTVNENSCKSCLNILNSLKSWENWLYWKKAFKHFFYPRCFLVIKCVLTLRKSLLRLPFVTRVLEVAQEIRNWKNVINWTKINFFLHSWRHPKNPYISFFSKVCPSYWIHHFPNLTADS